MIEKIINDDCLTYMKTMPDNYIDMVLTSPPYDNLRTYNSSLEWSFDIFKNIANELYRIIKKGAVIVWVVNDATINGSETGTSFKQALYFKEIGFNLYDTMIYEKNSFSHPDKYRYYQVFEYMFIFSKGKPKVINLIKDKINKYPGSWGNKKIREKNGELKNYKKKIICGKFGVRHNVWKYNTGGMGMSSSDNIANKHPAIFPEKLAKDHILSWSNEKDLILDPFAGSGTVGKMAIKTGRQFIMIEKEKKYINIIKKRIQKAYDDTSLLRLGN